MQEQNRITKYLNAVDLEIGHPLFQEYYGHIVDRESIRVNKLGVFVQISLSHTIHIHDRQFPIKHTLF
jgi:hypothetical protein